MNEIILELENKLTNAEKTADEKTLSELLAEDFKGINIRKTRIDKSGFINGVCHAGFRFNELIIENLEIVTKENTAVVIGESIFEIDSEGLTLKGNAQYIDVWNLSDDKWQLVSSAVISKNN